MLHRNPSQFSLRGIFLHYLSPKEVILAIVQSQWILMASPDCDRRNYLEARTFLSMIRDISSFAEFVLSLIMATRPE